MSANAGTPYHRLRHGPGTFDQVVALSVAGTSKADIARAMGLSPSTVTRWVARAARYAEAFNDATIKQLEPIEIQSDEIRGVAITKSKPLWAYTATEVWSRLWITTRTGRRKFRSTLLHL